MSDDRRTTPDFEKLKSIERDLLQAKLEAVRATIVGRKHPGEKGRALEHEATRLFRSMLPAEYGVATGFVVWLDGRKETRAFHGDSAVPGDVQISDQLDVIIYDAVRGTPLVDLGSCQVFAIEHVLGVAEVKTVAENDLPRTASLSKQVRDPDWRWYSVPGSRTTSRRLALSCSEHHATRVRFFLVAFSSKTDNEETIRAALEHCVVSAGAHAHLDAALVVDHGCFWTRPLADGRVEKRGDDVGSFKTTVLTALNRSFRPSLGWSAELDRYLDAEARAEPAMMAYLVDDFAGGVRAAPPGEGT